MDINRYYSVIVLKGTQTRRFAVSPSGIRCLLWTILLLLLATASYWSNYDALQKKRIHKIIAAAEAQRASVSSLQKRTNELQELLSRWKLFRERIQASLPERFRVPSDTLREDEELQQILGQLQSQLKQMISSFPSDWPVRGHVVSGVGTRVSPWTGGKEFHSGLDIPNPVGAPVHAPGDGIVESAGERGGKGLSIVLDHGQEIRTEYAHLSKVLVNERGRVRRGQRIGLVGNSGKSTGPHLHYEVRIKGIPIDPRKGIMTVASYEH